MAYFGSNGLFEANLIRLLYMQISSGITIKISKKIRFAKVSKAANAYLPSLVASAAILSKSALTIIIRAPYEIMCVFAHHLPSTINQAARLSNALQISKSKQLEFQFVSGL